MRSGRMRPGEGLAAPQPGGGEGRAEQFPIKSGGGPRLCPEDPTWDGQSCPSNPSRQGVDSPSADCSDPPPQHTHSLTQPSAPLHTPGPLPHSCPQPCPSGKLRDICCVTEVGLFPGQSGWGGGAVLGQERVRPRLEKGLDRAKGPGLTSAANSGGLEMPRGGVGGGQTVIWNSL